MQVVPYDRNPQPVGWWDVDIVKNTQCITSNVFLERFSAPLPYICGVNLPLRILSCMRAYREREYRKIAFDVAAFSALFFPGGVQAAIAIDCLSEMTNTYVVAKKTLSNKKNQPRSKNTQFNSASVKNLYCIAVNVFASIYRMPSLGVLALNLPLRARSLAMVYPVKMHHCWKWILDATVLAILLTPNTPQEVTAAAVTSIVMDCISQAIGMHRKGEDESEDSQDDEDTSYKKMKQHILEQGGIVLDGRMRSCEILLYDYTARENALAILELTETEAQNRSIVEEKYRLLKELYAKAMTGKRMAKVGKRKDNPIRIMLEIHMENCDKAYRTISESIRSDQMSTGEELREEEVQMRQ